MCGDIPEEVATTGLVALGHLVDERYPHVGTLRAEARKLRGAITFYDVLYVALATRLELPLLTADAKLARAPGVTCEVER